MSQQDTKKYEAVKGAKVNSENSVSMRLGTWRSRHMPPNSVSSEEHWTDAPVKLFGVWLTRPPNGDELGRDYE